MIKVIVKKRANGDLIAEAKKGRKTVGMLQAISKNRKLTVVMSEVDPEYRGQGVHNKMVLRVLESEKPKRVEIITVANSVLEQWARKYGFKEESRDRYGKIFAHTNSEELAKKIERRLRE